MDEKASDVAWAAWKGSAELTYRERLDVAITAYEQARERVALPTLEVLKHGWDATKGEQRPWVWAHEVISDLLQRPAPSAQPWTPGIRHEWADIARNVAKHHQEKASHGGAGWEFHARAQTFAENVLELATAPVASAHGGYDSIAHQATAMVAEQLERDLAAERAAHESDKRSAGEAMAKAMAALGEESAAHRLTADAKRVAMERAAELERELAEMKTASGFDSVADAYHFSKEAEWRRAAEAERDDARESLKLAHELTAKANAKYAAEIAFTRAAEKRAAELARERDEAQGRANAAEAELSSFKELHDIAIQQNNAWRNRGDALQAKLEALRSWAERHAERDPPAGTKQRGYHDAACEVYGMLTLSQESAKPSEPKPVHAPCGEEHHPDDVCEASIATDPALKSRAAKAVRVASEPKPGNTVTAQRGGGLRLPDAHLYDGSEPELFDPPDDDEPKPGDVLSGEAAKAYMLANPGRRVCDTKATSLVYRSRDGEIGLECSDGMLQTECIVFTEGEYYGWTFRVLHPEPVKPATPDLDLAGRVARLEASARALIPVLEQVFPRSKPDFDVAMSGFSKALEGGGSNG